MLESSVRSDDHVDGAAFVRQVHGELRDLMPPRLAVYWCDFLLTIAIAYAALALFLVMPISSWYAIPSGIVAGLALYRASVFIHELAHLPSERFFGFRVVWNCLFGIPFLTPSFLYDDHRSHHTNRTYGTAQDAEYYPLAHGPIGVVVGYAAQVVFLPPLAVLRFAVVGPLSWVIPPLRKVVWERASSLANINPRYRRPPAPAKHRKNWFLQELGCALFVWSVILLTVIGVFPGEWWGKLYAVFLLLLSVNYLRALGSHLYTNEDGELSYVEQMLDSTTIVGTGWLTELWAPLGMRYHALHHLLPALPYHAMPTGHKRLMEVLPPNSPYHRTLRPGLWSVVKDICRSAWNRQPSFDQISRPVGPQ